MLPIQFKISDVGEFEVLFISPNSSASKRKNGRKNKKGIVKILRKHVASRQEPWDRILTNSIVDKFRTNPNATQTLEEKNETKTAIYKEAIQCAERPLVVITDKYHPENASVNHEAVVFVCRSGLRVFADQSGENPSSGIKRLTIATAYFDARYDAKKNKRLCRWKDFAMILLTRYKEGTSRRLCCGNFEKNYTLVCARNWGLETLAGLTGEIPDWDDDLNHPWDAQPNPDEETNLRVKLIKRQAE